MDGCKLTWFYVPYSLRLEHNTQMVYTHQCIDEAPECESPHTITIYKNYAFQQSTLSYHSSDAEGGQVRGWPCNLAHLILLSDAGGIKWEIHSRRVLWSLTSNWIDIRVTIVLATLMRTVLHSGN